MSKGRKRALLALELVLLALLVPSPALHFGEGIVTPYGLCVTAAVLLAVILFQHLRLREVARPKDGLIAVLFRVDALELTLWCIPAALLGARLLYCAMRPGYYLFDMGLLSVLRLREGGFLLYGAAFGALLAAALLAKKRKASVLSLLDQMAVPGLFAIAMCRFGEWFAGEGLGPWIEKPAWMRLPFAVQNSYGEWQLALFLFEACCAALIVLPVLRVKQGEGERIAAALVLYASAQILLESLRMDSCLRIGFVRVSQAISAVVILAVTAWRWKKEGGRSSAVRRSAAALGCIVLIGGIEWALDKTQISNFLLYAAMAALCALLAVNALYIKRKDTKA